MLNRRGVLRHRRTGGRRQSQNAQSALDDRYAAELRRALKLDASTCSTISKPAPTVSSRLENDEFCTLNEGVMRQSGNKALIAAGTGLGQAILYDDGHHFHPLGIRRRPRRFRAAQ